MSELDADIRDHIENETQDNIQRGIEPEEARRLAMVRFGSVAMAREDVRAVWVWRWADEFRQDVRYALRALRRSPTFAAVVILTLALGIGMNTAVFSVFNAVVLRPIAYPHPDRLVWLSTFGADTEPGLVAGPDFVDWRDGAASFDRMVAYGHPDYTMVDSRGATRVRAARVTEDFWDLAGVRPVAGRLPRVDERGNVVLLSHTFAERRFHGDPGVIGRAITLDGRQVTIVGVLPEDFRFHFPTSPWPGFKPREVDVYRPFFVSSAREGQIQLLNVVARLRPGVTLERAQAEIETIRERIAEAHPHPMHDQRRLRAVPLHDQLIGDARQALWVLLTAVAFVLLIACANAANLLLARGSARSREIAIRVSVGAGRARVLRQLLVESAVLAVLGSAAGLLLARGSLAAIQRVNPHAVPRLAEATLDGRVLGVVLGTALLTAFVFGLLPALALWTVSPSSALRGGARGQPSSASSSRMRRLLVCAELALALVLLTGAGLMLKSVWHLHSYPSGFEPARVLTATVEFSGREYFEPRQQVAFVGELLRRAHAQPNIEDATISNHGRSLMPELSFEGEPPATPEQLAGKSPIILNSTTAAFARVMGLRMVRGHWIVDDQPVAVVNETLARREFRGKNPIGQRVGLLEEGPLFTIVGIVADLRYSKLDAAPEPELYVPYAQLGQGLFGFTTLVRTRGNPLASRRQ
jgi:putative ABC transport system permease protein